MNKKERRLALATALQSAAPDMIVVDSISSDGKVRPGRDGPPRPAPGRAPRAHVDFGRPFAFGGLGAVGLWAARRAGDAERRGVLRPPPPAPWRAAPIPPRPPRGCQGGTRARVGDGG
jgi:hypothetical protein